MNINKDLMIYLGIVGILMGTLFGVLREKPEQEKVSEPKQVEVQRSINTNITPPDPCGLDTVICPEKEEFYEHEIYEVSAYSKPETCPDRECITASGRTAQAAVTVACPRSLPLGTKIKINGHEYRCDDRLARRYDHRIDLYFGDTQEDYERALKWGVKKLEVEIL